MVMGHNDSSLLYLIDFGLSTRFVDDQGVLVEKQQLGRFSGNFLFTSLNACRGYNKCRRDDMEAAFYILIYLINNKTLPWSDFDMRFKGMNFKFQDLLKERLKRHYSCQLFKMVPNNLQECLKSVLCLKYEDTPNYDHILNCF